MGWLDFYRTYCYGDGYTVRTEVERPLCCILSWQELCCFFQPGDKSFTSYILLDQTEVFQNKRDPLSDPLNIVTYTVCIYYLAIFILHNEGICHLENYWNEPFWSPTYTTLCLGINIWVAPRYNGMSYRWYFLYVLFSFFKAARRAFLKATFHGHKAVIRPMFLYNKTNNIWSTCHSAASAFRWT